MQTPLVGKCEQYINGAWVDLSSRVSWGDGGSPVEISRGIDDSGAPLSGSMTLTMDNNDGALTPGGSGSWGPYLVRWRPIRVSVLVSGTYRQRFHGFVDSEPLSWPTGDAGICVVTVTAVDLAALAAVRSLRSIAVEATAAKSPLAYWPLTDAETVSAADQSGMGRPGLDVQQQGTGGEVSWGGGVALPTDLAGGLLLTPASDNGVYLASLSDTIDLPASWSLSVVITPAAKDGYVCQVSTSVSAIGIWYDTSAKKLSAIEQSSQEDGDPVEWVLSTSTSAITPGAVETLTVTATTVKLGSSGTTGTRNVAGQMLGATVTVGASLTETPGRQRMYSGEVKHLALWSGAVPANVASDILTGPSGLTTIQGITEVALGWAGLSGTVTTRGTNRATITPAIEGATATALMGDMARGSLGRIAANRSGGITITAFDYSSAAVVAPAGEIDPEVEWAADPEADVTQATMSWPDGTSYIVTDLPDRPTDLPGVLPQAAGRSVTEWTVKAPAGAPRLPDAGYDLLTLPDADVVALCALDVGDLLTTPSLPTQLPSSSQTSIVDSFTETIGVDQWMLRMATSSDPRDQIFKVGDATRGVVGAGYLAAPLGAGGAIGAWRAGETIDASKLNARQYAGVMVQAGRVTLTPVANTPTSLTVTFPTAFAAAPSAVVVTPVTDKPSTEVGGYCVSGITASGFTLWGLRTTTTPIDFDWLAVT